MLKDGLIKTSNATFCATLSPRIYDPINSFCHIYFKAAGIMFSVNVSSSEESAMFRTAQKGFMVGTQNVGLRHNKNTLVKVRKKITVLVEC